MADELENKNVETNVAGTASGNGSTKSAEKTITVPEKTLVEIQERMAQMEREVEEGKARSAGLEAMLDKGATPEGQPKIREKKNFEPKFRTVRIRKYPIAGDVENQGYVVGWTSQGAYQQVDRTGISPQIVDFIDIIFLGQEKTEEGKIKAERVKLLDLMNQGIQVNCKIVETFKETKDVPTGEEISVQVFDPKHGLVATGEIIDGFTSYSEIKYKIQIPGVAEPVLIDSLYCN